VQDEVRSLRIKQLRLIVVVMFVILIAMVGYTIFWTVNYNTAFKDYEYINSEVVEHREVDGKQRDVFQFKIDMIEYNVVSDNESKYDIGDSVKICYDKNNPINIISEFDSKRIILPILCGIFGALTIGLMIVYIMIYVSFQRTQGNNKSIKKALND